ncbi:putative archaeal Zn-finger protein [Archaeoglobus sulfaticallidus PM70-1]|uniref:Putative archaeal Zn-finger protein n=1 Tax=Archaeoglobus sulfaticallidus PM70-1 TaxID=387631 RepID=N0BC79_9EURY|nr:HVO_0476 family zinc finger protein [Archaeoglobus sulfaticallidus]AGK61224.1 putative archaeal Zn-finger protein [Archaeoglobus sulfaticallidus PM70-1]
MKVYYCDVCRESTMHSLVREKTNLYKCEECGNYVTITPEKEIVVNAIISSEGESERGKVRLKEGENVEKGDELVVEVEEGFKIGEVTSIELEDGKRIDLSPSDKIKTVWLRDIGEVGVKFSLHKRAITTPVTLYMPGETEIRVGEDIDIENKRFRITKIKTRDGRLYGREGDTVMAKDVKRVYAMFQSKIKK